ncbi:hypothetical protein BBFGKLBO_00105 [Synechococcus sp. CBW1107]|nr:hypothetical protein BBFGKLBO_00105 [Synechococcus sp. CBW1107]
MRRSSPRPVLAPVLPPQNGEFYCQRVKRLGQEGYPGYDPYLLPAERSKDVILHWASV